MLRKLLIASSLLVASGSASALDQYLSKPRVSITFSSGPDYVYRDHYREVYVPRPVYVEPVYYNNYYYRGNSRRHYGHHDSHHDEWREHKKHKYHHRKYHHDYDH